MDTAQELQRGLELHRIGQVADAAEAYRNVLKADPNNVDALNLISIIFTDTGSPGVAVDLASRAAQLAPDYFAVWLTLGNACQVTGQLERAVDAFLKAASLQPDVAEVHNNLASALVTLGHYTEAAGAAARALKIDPNLAEAHNNLGNALAGMGEIKQAIETYRKAVRLRPDFTDAIYNLGGAYMDDGRLEQAIVCYQTAIAREPERAAIHYNLGNAQMAVGHLEPAIASYRAALRIEPRYLDALNNLGGAQQASGDLDGAAATFRQALAIEPENAELHWNLSLALLAKGDYAEGWREYEWRWRHAGFTSPRRKFAQPEWDGGELNGRTILVHAEQGFGDTLQFVRYLPQLAARGGTVILECRKPLVRLLAQAPGVSRIVAMGEALPDFDLHCPLLSLPHRFATTLETVPTATPYLTVPAGVEADPRIAAAKGLKIGFAWAGSATNRNEINRGAPVDLFAPLFDLSGLDFFSLQADERAQALAPLVEDGKVVDLGPALTDFAVTAACVAALDLVVTVDTAIAHLAGALGKPAIVLLSYAPGFLWMRDRDATPWYPTLKLLRQPKWGDWSAVFKRLEAQLIAEAKRRGAAR